MPYITHDSTMLAIRVDQKQLTFKNRASYI